MWLQHNLRQYLLMNVNWKQVLDLVRQTKGEMRMYSQIHKLCEQPKNLVNGQDFEVKLIAARNCRETPEFVAYQSIKPFPSESFARCSKQGGLWKNCWRLESLYWSLLLHSFRFYCCILYQLWSGQEIFVKFSSLGQI